ncbi:MAG: hypothetical protein FRX49_05803 [Trebouxia sp. A1-2]|nr:MAG: hypothetical protein FRX49_05803 [Trebouxia sp. A1-2]
MPQTASSSGDAEQQTADDEEEESFTHGVVQVPRLEDMCRRQAYSNMRESTRRTTVSNLPEEAQIGASNIRHLLMTSLDVRKAFRHTYNLDRVLEGKVDHAIKSVLFKAVLAHSTAYHTVATTAYHNELIVLWGLSKSSKDLAWLATRCADKLLHSCNAMAASSSQQADSIQGYIQHINKQACSNSNATEATTSKQRKGQLTLNWTFGEGSSVGSSFEVIARWLEPNRSATAAAEKEAIACTATKLINPETQIHRKSFVGLMVLTSIEQLPSIEPSEVVLQMISSTQLDRVHRILRSLGKAMSVSASNLMLCHQQKATELALATYEDLLAVPEAREQLQLVADARDCLFIIQLSKRITQKPFTAAR